MTTAIKEAKAIINKVDSVNAEYILKDEFIKRAIETIASFEADGKMDIVGHLLTELQTKALDTNKRNLTPANAKVGEGVTMHLYSDAHAGTIVKATKTTITVQRDNAELDSEFKPQFDVGGFAGHCTNQSEQKYTYTPNPNAEKIVFRWNENRQMYMNKSRGLSITKGRREFYDYNF